MLFGIGAAADGMLKKSKKAKYAELLFAYRPNFASDVARTTVTFFEIVFDGQRGRIVFLRSVLLSILLFVVIAMVTTQVMGENLIDLIKDGTHDNRGALVAMIVVNCIADYFSLVQTKHLMRWLVGRNVIVQMLGLLFDVVFTFLVISGCVAIVFFILANAVGVQNYSNPLLIPWQMCHQWNSTIMVISQSFTTNSGNCDFILGSVQRPQGANPNFEYAFNSASLLTSYATSAWVGLFLFIQGTMLVLQKAFKPFSRVVTKRADYRAVPFSITALFFALLYLFTSALLLGADVVK